MKKIKQLLRLIKINHVLAKNGLDQVVISLHLFRPLRFIIALNPWNWFRRQKLSRGEALRQSFEELGPIFVKFGQALSTRPDIVPQDIIQELRKLQDKVPPFQSDIALEIIERTFGRSAFEVFAHFDETPLASASIAQVHAASLKNGKEVVVKILRPNIREVIEQDLGLLHSIATLAERYWKESRRFKPCEVVREFEHNLIDELDLQREAANASQLRRNFENSEDLYVPEVYWDYIYQNILVMERIYGIPIANIETLKAEGFCLKTLAERGVNIFFTQVFRDCFFHADMHPGNIFVSHLHPKNPQYICIDFGIIGTLNDNDKRYLADNLLAFFNRDYRRVAELHVESGWVARGTRVDEFESAIRCICEPIFECPLKDISFGQLVLRLFQVARRFDMEVQPQLILLQKTLLAVEGLGRQLYPELDLWTTAKPFLEKWVAEQIGPKALLQKFRKNIPFFTEQLPMLPQLIYDNLALYKEEKIKTLSAISHKDLKQQSSQWRQGLSFGLSISLFSYASIHYFHLLNTEKLLNLSGVAALCLATLTLIYSQKRN